MRWFTLHPTYVSLRFGVRNFKKICLSELADLPRKASGVLNRSCSARADTEPGLCQTEGGGHVPPPAVVTPEFFLSVTDRPPESPVVIIAAVVAVVLMLVAVVLAPVLVLKKKGILCSKFSVLLVSPPC